MDIASRPLKKPWRDFSSQNNDESVEEKFNINDNSSESINVHERPRRNPNTANNIPVHEKTSEIEGALSECVLGEIVSGKYSPNFVNIIVNKSFCVAHKL